MAKRRYTKGDELTVLWDSAKCTHCEVCKSHLPAVFNPEARPWVDLSKADTESIKTVVNQCPSGALSLEVL